MMERELLLLGILRMQEMHGYQINELIDKHLGTSIEIKKPTVYKLLDNMLSEGWISVREEQEGNYPRRRVYTLTLQGEAAFLRLLRENLTSYKPVSYMSNVGLVFLGALPVEESASLLRRRRQEVRTLVEKMFGHEELAGGFALMVSFHLSLLNAELDWLDEIIDEMQPT